MPPTPYDLNLPCLNPQCKSHGRPHPNCRCYGFSEGGEVKHYCSEARSHKEGCEYFMAQGGEVPSWDSLSPEPPTEKTPSWDSLSKEPPTTSSTPSWDSLSEAPPEKPVDRVDQLKAAAQSVSRGVFGGLSDVAQVKSGISTLEDIERRKKEYPAISAVGEGAGFAAAMAAPLGPARLIMAKAGSKLLGNVLASSAYALSDNTAKAFLGQPGGDVNSVVAGTVLRGGMEGMMNTLTSGLFAAAPKAAKAVFNEKAIKAFENFAIGFADKPVSKLSPHVIGGATAKLFGATGASDLLEYSVVKDGIKKVMSKLDKPIKKADDYVGDAILNALIKTDFAGIPTAIRWAERASHGMSAVSEPIEALFKGATHVAAQKTEESIVEEIKNWMEEGGIDGELQRGESENPQGFASGGIAEAPTRSFEKLYPTENIMLNQARGRVSNYLNTLRPSKIQPKAPFDMNVPQKQKEKAYRRALEIAANPMKVMSEMNKGSLSPDDVKHMKSMWPEAHDFLSKKITERIIKAQMKGEKPPYKKRQSMSLFLGTDLDSSFSAQSIAAVQGVYAMRKQQTQQAVQGSKKAISKASNQYRTNEQARESRMQNQK